MRDLPGHHQCLTSLQLLVPCVLKLEYRHKYKFVIVPLQRLMSSSAVAQVHEQH